MKDKARRVKWRGSGEGGTSSLTKKTRRYNPTRSMASPSHAVTPLALGIRHSAHVGLAQSQQARMGEQEGWRQQELGVICPESMAPVIAGSSKRTCIGSWVDVMMSKASFWRITTGGGEIGESETALVSGKSTMMLFKPVCNNDDQ
jgi:hypothetical protein